jgi:hypothetical protein
MLLIEAEIPRPSRYVSNLQIDDIALEANRAYRAKTNSLAGFPVDVDRMLDLLEVSTVWEELEEPEGAAFFARYTPDRGGLITVNERHRPLFEARPDVYAACLGHECGHRILRHFEIFESDSMLPSLFEDSTSPPVFHKSSWYQYGLSREEVEKSKAARKVLDQTLARHAWISETAHRTLKEIHTHFEPEWVFWQAEHFSLCLRIPHDRLKEKLEAIWDLGNWRTIYRLAEMFGVSGSMMRLRLEKLDLIEIDEHGLPRAKEAPQNSLFAK